jgi:Glycosyl hydrolase catalytic core
MDDDHAMRRVLIAAVAAALLALGPATASAAQATVGISDQEAGTYLDPLLAWTGIAQARVIVPWDVAFRPDASRYDRVLSVAHNTYMNILVSFEHRTNEVCPEGPCYLPSASQYRLAFAAFHQRWPYVKTISPWNEANHPSQPTAEHPGAAAAYYREVRDVCPECRVLGAEVVDISNLEPWLKRFKTALPSTPRLWGLHNYGDVTRRRSTMTRRMLSTVPGEVWLTETGGLVRFQRRDGTVNWPYDEGRAARSVEYLFALADDNPRITRVYLYNWRAIPWLRWDSALLSATGEPRPSFYALAARLRPGQKVPANLRRRLPRARVVRRPRYRWRDGRVLATVACPRAHIQRCAVVMAVRTKRPPKRLHGKARRRALAHALLGERSVRIRAGHRRVLRVRVLRARRTLIRRGKTRVLRVQMWLGGPRPRQYRVRCRRARRH